MHPKEPATFFFGQPVTINAGFLFNMYVLLKLIVSTTRNGRMYEFCGDEINNLKLLKLPIPIYIMIRCQLPTSVLENKTFYHLNLSWTIDILILAIEPQTQKILEVWVPKNNW